METDVDGVAPPEGLRAVADVLRWRILTLLGREEMCVCHLVEALDAPQSLVSHHLRALRDAGLVESERYRYWTYYRLRPDALEELGRQLIGLAGGDSAGPRFDAAAVLLTFPGACPGHQPTRRKGTAAMAVDEAARRETALAVTRGAVAEAVGTALLVATVVGSGIFAQRLSPGDPGLQLLENSTATAFGLMALILAFGKVSGAHFNPVVTLADRALGGVDTRRALAYIGAQVAGGCAGTIIANLMFGLPAAAWSTHARSGGGLWLGEVVATFGLLTVILGVVRSGRSAAAPFAVGAYIGAAYWFTSSTSFANPAVTIARTLTDTFAGIKPESVPPFVVAQCAGAALAVALARFLHPALPEQAERIVVPRDEP